MVALIVGSILLLVGAVMGALWYRRCGDALAADTLAHEHHEADPSPGDQRGRS